MIIKYNDFKVLTINEMKKIVGGNEPPPVECGKCPSSSGGGVKITCYKDTLDFCVKPANCNNAVDCKEEA